MVRTDLYTPYDVDNFPLNEYPRPQFRRDSYRSLNGLWHFEIRKEKFIPSEKREILVPFSPETNRSLIHEEIPQGYYLYYKKEVSLDEFANKEHILLHFLAVDQVCDVYINQKHAHTHEGGFFAFEVDIAPYIQDYKAIIEVYVLDLTDQSFELTGKQRIKHGGIWYKGQSGIYQPVFLEAVHKDYIKDLTITPSSRLDGYHLKLETNTKDRITIETYFNGKRVHRIETLNHEVFIPLEAAKLWSPSEPNLYEVVIKTTTDEVKTYVGIRLFERKKDDQGLMRFYLNHEPYFLTGLLDQGYYSDTYLTNPSDQALIDDILLAKRMGFNFLRKHIKIEAYRWYYHCDRLGMLVMQDMPNSTERQDIIFFGILAILGIHPKDNRYKLFGRKHLEGRKNYLRDLNRTLNQLKNVTSIFTWVPFNEAWGQFDSKKAVEIIKRVDQTRLIDHASGWSDQGISDYYSRHIYFTPIWFRKSKAKKRIASLSEFGGYSLKINNHIYQEDVVFGYKVFKDKDALMKALEKLYLKKVASKIKKGLSVLVYTQLSDVFDEVNGLITFDRRVIKVDEEKINEINAHLYNVFMEATRKKT